jgi:4-amino-4-deoxy-L-arabinose transferase-like glycosyltransferase
MTVSASAPPWTPAAAPPARTGRWARLLRGRETDARWVRPSLLGLLLGTAVLYLWGLGRSGYANDYYSAAVQAGATSWKAFFFGSFDSSNYITVDKTPAALWVMELSGRLFGVNSWSILAPQAIEGVLAVGLLYAAVRRVSGPAAGLLAGAVLACTPVATLMFRFNNPDALLALLLVLGGYATLRAVQTGRTAWLLLAGSAVGVGFLAKMLQALLVLPALGLTYLIAGPPRLRRRIVQLAAGLAALVGSAGWWVAIVELMPASARPYIGGSRDNSILELTLGYNGLGRLTGDEIGSGGGPAGGAGGDIAFGGGGFGGPAGWNRLFSAEMGGQASWLLPTALIALVAGLWLAGRRPRTDQRRAGYLLWGGSLLVTAAVFSYMRGIFHPYYLIALAPPIGALVGTAAVELWQRRRERLPRVLLAGMVGAAAVWSAVLLNRSPDWNPWLRPLILAAGAAAVLGLLVGPLARPRLRFAGPRLRRAAAPGVAGIGLVAALAGPLAYSLSTSATAYTGAVPSAGPAAAGAFGPAGGPFGGRLPGGPNAAGPQGAGGLPGGGDLPNQGQFPGGQLPGGQFPGGQLPGGPGEGGPRGSTPVDSKLVDLLRAGGDGYTWTAAAVGAMAAAPLQLASGEPIMALGGFSGSDPATTLAEFQRLVAAGKVHYFLADRGFGGFGADAGGRAGGQGGPFGASSAAGEISTWVAENFTAEKVGDTTVYDLSAGTSS